MPASGLKLEANAPIFDEVAVAYVELKKQSPMFDSTENIAKHRHRITGHMPGHIESSNGCIYED